MLTRCIPFLSSCGWPNPTYCEWPVSTLRPCKQLFNWDICTALPWSWCPWAGVPHPLWWISQGLRGPASAQRFRDLFVDFQLGRMTLVRLQGANCCTCSCVVGAVFGWFGASPQRGFLSVCILIFGSDVLSDNSWFLCTSGVCSVKCWPLVGPPASSRSLVSGRVRPQAKATTVPWDNRFFFFIRPSAMLSQSSNVDRGPGLFYKKRTTTMVVMRKKRLQDEGTKHNFGQESVDINIWLGFDNIPAIFITDLGYFCR